MSDPQTPFPSLFQPEKGYRYNLDSFLLVRFAQLKPEDHVCDLGAGVGILGLLALQRYQVQKVVAVELQAELAELAQKNAELLGFEKHFQVMTSSWQEYVAKRPREKFDAVLSNPPYRKLQTGRLSSLNSKALAKHEISGGMEELLLAAKKLLKIKGRLYLIYPVLRLEELIAELQKLSLKCQRLGLVHPYENEAATHVIVEAICAPTRELTVEAPIVIYRDPEHYRPEIEAWIGPKQRN